MLHNAKVLCLGTVSDAGLNKLEDRRKEDKV